MSGSTRFKRGTLVQWISDGEVGHVTGGDPGHSVAIRWHGSGHIFWYPLKCVAVLERIEVLDQEEVTAW